MLPVRRDIHFDLSTVDFKRWHARGPMVGHYLNALSIFFPDGERFFIHSVRLFRDRVKDPQLQKAVAGFIGQEAMHGREHEEYNQALAKAGLPARWLGRAVYWQVRLMKLLPARVQLAITIALEHFTAIYANLLLSDPSAMAGSNPTMVAMWRWHALEETEHKSVAFDVYRVVMGRGLAAYLLRTVTLTLITAGFLMAIFWFHLRLIVADPGARGWQQVGQLFSFLFGRVGALWRLGKPWLDYFKPGFEPWDHDNRHFLGGIDRLVAEIDQLPRGAAA